MEKKPKTLEQQKAEIEFYPVQSADNGVRFILGNDDKDAVPFAYRPPSYETNEFMRTMLPKGKYDIDYVINLLGIIIDNCGPLSSILSIKEGCKKLQGYLKVEKCPSHQDPRILVTCPICGESVVIAKSIAHHLKCPCNKNTKMLD